MKYTSKLRNHSSLRNWVSQRDPSKRSNTITLSSEVKGDDWAEITTTSEHPSLPRKLPTINVVLFGETFAGKSSVINLIAREDVARVSSDVNGCIMQSTRYDISFDNMDFAIFDTIGFEEPQMGVNGYLKAIEKAYELIVNLSAAGGVHLLLFCMRGVRITTTTQSNYRLFCEYLCTKKVPIALVFTGLEREVEMENWWKRNETYVTHYGIKSDGHACITTVRDDTPGVDLKYRESQRKIRELLKTHALKNEGFSLETLTWFTKVGNSMRSLTKKQRIPGEKNIIRVLTQRCKLDPDTARRIAEMMEKIDMRTEGEDGLDEGEKEDLAAPGGHAPADQREKAGVGYGNSRPEREDGKRPVEGRNGGPPTQGPSRQMGSEETTNREPDWLVGKTEGEDRSQPSTRARNEGKDDRAKSDASEKVHGTDDSSSGYHTVTQEDDTEDELLTGIREDLHRPRDNRYCEDPSFTEIMAASNHLFLPKKPPTINVVLFGETGVGKSSVINLIAQRDIARVSSDVNGCTMQSTRYDISFDNMYFAIFETIGLEEPQMGVDGYLKTIEKTYELIVNLSAAGGIHLLLFCMRGGTITSTTQCNYRLFRECLCDRKVPIAFVFTGLEQEMEMEDWWRRNETYMTHYGMKSNGHACITAVQDDALGENLKYKESQGKIRELLKTCVLKNDALSLETLTWFARVGKLMRSLITRQRAPGRKNVIEVLTQCCKLDPDTARRIVEMMEGNDVKTEHVSTLTTTPA